MLDCVMGSQIILAVDGQGRVVLYMCFDFLWTGADVSEESIVVVDLLQHSDVLAP